MRFLCAIIYLVAFVAVIAAFPEGELVSKYYNVEDVHPGHFRQRRALCDHRIGLGYPACAIHCLKFLRRNSYCDSKKVCNCRD